jgi:hypothetical protein
MIRAIRSQANLLQDAVIALSNRIHSRASRHVRRSPDFKSHINKQLIIICSATLNAHVITAENDRHY